VWRDRLHVFHTDFQSFANGTNGPYDLIVSNPPFFINSLKTRNAALAVARHNDILNFSQLVLGARKLLNNEGRLCIIIPSASSVEFREIARLAGFYLRNQTMIIPKTGRAPKRVLMEFGVQPCYPLDNVIVVLDENGFYTADYKTLTASFYLAF
jgi:tRNA1Val (adenine37-N6)-methyltransferase